MNSFEFVGIEVEWHATSEIHTVVDGISTEECAGTNSQIVHTIFLYGATKVGDRVGGETLSNLYGISARDDNEFVSSQLRLAHGVQLGRVRSEITNAERLENRFHGFNIRRSPCSVKKKDRFRGGYGGRQRGSHLGISRGSTSAEQNCRGEESHPQDQPLHAVEEGKARTHKKPSKSASSLSPWLGSK